MVLALLRKKGVDREENDMEGKGLVGDIYPQSFGVSGKKRSQEKGSKPADHSPLSSSILGPMELDRTSKS